MRTMKWWTGAIQTGGKQRHAIVRAPTLKWALEMLDCISRGVTAREMRGYWHRHDQGKFSVLGVPEETRDSAGPPAVWLAPDTNYCRPDQYVLAVQMEDGMPVRKVPA